VVDGRHLGIDLCQSDTANTFGCHFAFDICCCRSYYYGYCCGKSRKPLGGREKEAPFKLELGDLPQDLSVHRSHFSSALNHTPAHSGGTSSGNGLRNSSPLPVAAHLQSAYSTHRALAGSTGRNPWPKDEIQVHSIHSSFWSISSRKSFLSSCAGYPDRATEGTREGDDRPPCQR